MKLIINNRGKEIELDGVIRGVNNKFYVEIRVPDEIKIESIITNIKGEYNFKGKVTLINNKNSSVRGSDSNPNERIYVYEVGYLVSGYVDEKNLLISSMLIYFKELDYFFVEDKYKMDIKKRKTELTVTQKYNSEILLDDENLSIKYNRTASIDHDLAGHTLLLNPAKMSILFKNPIKLSNVFEEISKIEKVLGFVFDKKINLIETYIYDNNNECHELIIQSQKEYNDVRVNDFFIVDLNSKQLLKDVLKKYYSDKRIAGAINMFYEYIYNDLDDIFEFTSLVNTLELILSDEKYKEKTRKYALETNKKLKQNNIEMNKIFEVISEEQVKFIKQFYRFNNVELRDKIKYTFYDYFKLQQNEKSEKYISAIINTRNYFVHGGKKVNILNPVDIIETKYLLKMILYILILNICTVESNPKVETNNFLIPTVYNTAIKYFN